MSIAREVSMRQTVFLGISLVAISMSICSSTQANDRSECRKKMGWTNGYANTITAKSSPGLYAAFQDCISKLAVAKKH
jgi:hypothetical protein